MKRIFQITLYFYCLESSKPNKGFFAKLDKQVWLRQGKWTLFRKNWNDVMGICCFAIESRRWRQDWNGKWSNSSMLLILMNWLGFVCFFLQWNINWILIWCIEYKHIHHHFAGNKHVFVFVLPIFEWNQAAH